MSGWLAAFEALGLARHDPATDRWVIVPSVSSHDQALSLRAGTASMMWPSASSTNAP